MDLVDKTELISAFEGFTNIEEIVERFPVPKTLRRPILVKPHVLMGSGPTNPSQRIIEALSKPVMGMHTEELQKVRSPFFTFLLSFIIRHAKESFKFLCINIACNRNQKYQK